MGSGPGMPLLGDPTVELHSQLIFMLRNDPHVRGALNRFQNSCVNSGMQWEENGKPLVAPLSQHMRQHFDAFMRNAIELCMYAGFVPFFINRIDNVPTPLALPIGSFTWHTEFSDAERQRKQRSNIPANAPPDPGANPSEPKHAATADDTPDNQLVFQPNLIIYRVRPRGGSGIDPKSIFVYPYVPAAAVPDGDALARLHSPLAGLLRVYITREQIRQQILEATHWNCQKHICVSENVDLKDQTTTGIQLLDELRRYKLTGAHSQLNDGVRMRSKRSQADLGTVNDGQFAWIHSEFNDESTPGARVHILPPNHELHELQPVPHSEATQYIDDAFARAVAAFFDVPVPDGQTQRSSNTNAAVEQTSKNQYEVILNMTRFLSTLGQEAYARCFNSKRGSIRLTINPAPRVDVSSAGDVKDLFEAGVFREFDKPKLRKRYHMEY